MSYVWTKKSPKLAARGKGNSEGWRVDTVKHDLMMFALHVISEGGFGVRLPFPEYATLATVAETDDPIFSPFHPPPGHTMTYARSLEVVLSSFITLYIIPPWATKWIPGSPAKEARTAYYEFKGYMEKLLERERTEGSAIAARGNLLSALLAAKAKKKSGEREFTEPDVFGNLFVFAFAGHETTA